MVFKSMNSKTTKPAKAFKYQAACFGWFLFIHKLKVMNFSNSINSLITIGSLLIVSRFILW